ncbi:MAG TPA: phytoene/squalene synthase family protein [Trinickia sp.]|jgi:farnesyl-diphosphate farnesyltransferase|uniref:phytoene/squalene synthase family protein n=1 Tax=Trinickia sp. TaxID=2571163 RepID=UPI002D15E5CB|nr:phytoene/squalene synthase family protein [Trinickia sp.]HVW53292.1 phytoene/squalene synthase family protein [Trinickia sp.]
MSNVARADLLGPLLKSVSRSFFLTLRILPGPMREPVGLAYLLARAADTIADTSLVDPTRRLRLLLALRAAVGGDKSASTLAAIGEVADEVAGQQALADEKRLLESLTAALTLLEQLAPADRAAVREIVITLTTGMEFDLRTFPAEDSGRIEALGEPAELDRYTYLVAGCVGEFWTKMTCAHVPGTFAEPHDAAVARGIRFGKALQLTNILRDCAKDLRIGRCYLPSSLLERHGLTPVALLAPDASSRAKPVLGELMATALAHYRDALDYALAIPRSSVRLRLACLWPILIGLETLKLLAENEAWLDPGRISKVRRNDVYRLIAGSTAAVCFDGLLRRWIEGLMREVQARLGSEAGAAAVA